MHAEINQKLTFVVNLGPANTGLATVGYTLVNGGGSTFQTRRTTGVTEIGNGFYYVEVANTVFTAVFDGIIEWDIATVFKTAEDVFVSDRTDAAISTRLATSGYTAPDNSDIAAIKVKTDLIPAAGPPDAAHYTNARGDKLDDLDAAISTRSTYAGGDTAGTTTLLARLTATRAGNLDFLDTAISGVAAAVWAIATRTLTAASDSSGVTTLLSRLTSTRAGLLDNLDASVSSRLATSGYTAPDNADVAAIKAKTDLLPSDPASESEVEAAIASSASTLAGLIAALPSASAIATAVWAAATRTLSSVTAIVNGVWNEATSGHQTAGTTGKALTDAGGGGDPWLTELPGSYTGDEAGAILAAISNKTALITSGTNIDVLSPTADADEIVLTAGDDYKAADGRALPFASDGWPDLTSATVTLIVKAVAVDEQTTIDGTVVDAGTVQVELTATQTTTIGPGNYRYALTAVLGDSSHITLAVGKLTVKDPTP